MTYCEYCPLAAHAKPCRGSRYCELVDPAHRDHDARYVRILLVKAGLAEREPETAIASNPEWAPRAMPSLLQRAANLAGAVVEHIAAGLPAAGDDEAARRLAICDACQEYSAGSCRLCGCNMPLKVHWAEQKCPIGKW